MASGSRTRGTGPDLVQLLSDRRGQTPHHAGAASRPGRLARLQSGRDDLASTSSGPHRPRSGTWPGVRSGSSCAGTRRRSPRRIQSRRGVGRHHERRLHHPDLGCPRRTGTGGPPGPHFMKAVAFSPDGDYLAAAAGEPAHGVPLPAHGSSRAAAAGRSRLRAPMPGLPPSAGPAGLRGRRPRPSSSGTRLGRPAAPLGGSRRAMSPGWPTAPMARCWPAGIGTDQGTSATSRSASGTRRPARLRKSLPGPCDRCLRPGL